MKTNNLPLIVGISLPLVFIVIISAVVFLPSFFVKPQYDFVYTTTDQTYGYYGYEQGYKNNYRVDNGKIVLEPVQVIIDPSLKKDLIVYKGDMPPLYRYDVKNNTSHEISLKEAQILSFDPGPSSPDGYTVIFENRNDGIFEVFGSNNNNSGLFISKGNAKKRLDGLVNNNQYYWYQGNFKLIGWIK
jgi:hypothetical protein